MPRVAVAVAVVVVGIARSAYYPMRESRPFKFAPSYRAITRREWKHGLLKTRARDLSPIVGAAFPRRARGESGARATFVNGEL
jgi:hypothetical protein